MYLVHEILEWYTCPLKSYTLHNEGCKSLAHASFIRENIRIINALVEFKKRKIENLHIIEGENISQSIALTTSTLKTKSIPNIAHACFEYKNVCLYIPILLWSNKFRAWKVIVPTMNHGIRQENLQYAALIKYIFNKLQLPLHQIYLSYFNIQDTNIEGIWVDFDITHKTDDFYDKDYTRIHELIEFTSSELATQKSNWHKCQRQYCDYCETQQEYEIDDVRTLRRAKLFIEELKSQNIQKISNIPSDQIPNNTVLLRQIEAVCNNSTIIIFDELEKFVSKLDYPRYYLDFEAFNTSVPYHFTTPYIHKQWGFTPFLFSLQWQEREGDKIHTLLWSMLPGKNQILKMWEVLKEHLQKAGSIVVYGGQFETEMLTQLANAKSENMLGDNIIEKLVDLQELFFNLSLYKPEQKGKISLKNICPIWIQGDYNSYKVNEGIAANHYFTVLTDNILGTFAHIEHIPYIQKLFTHASRVEDASIGLSDIADYCKYDTEVMIRLVSKVQDIIDELKKS